MKSTQPKYITGMEMIFRRLTKTGPLTLVITLAVVAAPFQQSVGSGFSIHTYPHDLFRFPSPVSTIGDVLAKTDTTNTSEVPPSALDLIQLEGIEVTATHLTTPMTSTGRSISVIGKEELRRSSATSLDELLRTFPGVNINARQQFGIQADIGMRGSTYSQVMVLLDNVPLSDPLTGHFNANIPVPLSEIGRIELIRGPASASYGANAVGGVIHIKTQAYLQRHLSDEQDESNNENLIEEAGTTRSNRASASVRQSTGSHALSISDGSVTYQTERWNFSAGARYARSDGEEFANPAYAAGLSQQETFRTFFDHANATVSARYSHSATPGQRFTFYTRTGIEQRDFNARYFYTNSLYDQSVENIRNQWALTSLEFRSGRNQLRVDGGVRRVTDEFNFNAAIAPVNEHTTIQTYLNVSHEFTTATSTRAPGSAAPGSISSGSAAYGNTAHGNTARGNTASTNTSIKNTAPKITTPSRFAELRLMTGVQLLDQQIESTDRGDHRDASLGVYVIGSLSDAQADRWRLTGSLRLQRDPNGETALLPQLSGSRQLQEGWTLRASAGRAIRNGDFTERYISNNLSAVLAGRSLGNPLLEPESSVTFDAGIDWVPSQSSRPTRSSRPSRLLQYGTTLRFSSTLFYRISDRLIDYVSTPAEEITTAREGQLTPAANYFYTRNIADSRTFGLELEGTVTHVLMNNLMNNHLLSSRLGYTWLQTDNKEGVVSRYIANHPAHQLSFSLDYAIPGRFSIRSESYFQTRDMDLSESLNSEVPSSYLVTNVKATLRAGGGRSMNSGSAKSQGWSDSLQFFIKIYNAANTQYQEVLGAPMPGRWISAGIELDL